ncbi:MAG: SEC-C domain-containing protein [Bryobacterales bacterium]|nr:SEC-C domain-containing protein [Bryobacterales bacterium]
MKHFTAPQIAVLQALAAGMTITAAAAHASVPRPDVYSWFDDPAFVHAFALGHQEYALTVRDRMLSLSAKALDTLEALLDNPKASPAVLLRAALALLTRKNWNLPAPQVSECLTLSTDTAQKAAADPGVSADESAYHRQLTEIYSNPTPTAKSAPTDSSPTPTPRNASCPCGSGQKFKRCCGRNAPPVLHGTPYPLATPLPMATQPEI